MEYRSTARNSRHVSLYEAVTVGLAQDGGIYMPLSVPRIPDAFFNNIHDLNLHEVAYVVADTLLGRDIDSATLKAVVTEALNFDIPLRKVAPGRYVLELFHGPTMSFKDIGSRFMAGLIGLSVPRHGDGRINILVATTGDTGGAVASAFHNLPGIDVTVLYSSRRMTQVQQAMFTTLGGNIHPVAVNGDFDDCHAMVRGVLADSDLTRRLHIISANSVNVARLLPQAIYYFHAYACLPVEERRSGGVVVGVPCGNLGNLTAAVIARRMGLPIKRIVAATNANDAFIRFLDSGTMTPRRAVSTIANAMDVGSPGNLPRLIDLYDGDIAALRHDISGKSYDDGSIADIMRRVYSSTGYLLDPHSATAYGVVSDLCSPDETAISLATSHPVKLRDTVARVTGVQLALPGQLAEALKEPRRPQRIPPTVDALVDFMSRL